MPTREQQRRVHAAVAVFSLALGSLMAASYVLIALSEGMLVPKAHLVADFREAGNISKDTEIQLAGKNIGKVLDIEFITQRYPCDPRTEDFGHPYQGRTDECEPWMFCASETPDPESSVGVCAVLEEYSGHIGDYGGCDGPGSCDPDHVCVTRPFRLRYRDVRWWGQAGWCVKFDPQSQRIRVNMEIEQSALQYIRTDSRASLTLNGILADPTVNISVGTNDEQIVDGDRLQTVPSMIDEVLGLKDQIDKIADDIDRGLLGVSALTDSLNDEATKANIKALRENITEIQRQVSAAEGLVGAVLNDPNTRSEVSRTIRDTRNAAFAAQADFDELQRKSKRSLAQVQRAANKVEVLLDGLDDPTNTSLLAVLLNDEHGVQAEAAGLGDGTQEVIGAGLEALADFDAALAEIMKAVDQREGSLGRLIADPKPLYHIKDPATLRRVNVVKSLVRWVIAEDEAQAKAQPEAGD
jgi:ABC-type transporter Mla subunit MlaD